ncbi:MAG: vitamin B12 dependent-methionine synthase activation domain-containing protein [Bacteroides sp.]|nr:vitamin B12 dependent-methionine synthase activation domain-containing protein [Bacteroides sp.]
MVETKSLASGGSVLTYQVHEVVPYINWIYFFHAWGFQPKFAAIAYVHGCEACHASWLASLADEDRTKAKEAIRLFKETEQVLNVLEADVTPITVYRLCQANADGDDLILDGTVFPLLRQQTPHADGSPYLCLSDFVRPLSSHIPDTVGVFAASVLNGETVIEHYKDDPFRSLIVQILLERLAEAATEKMHEYVRKVAWGYAPDESLPIADLLVEKYQGIRPAVGYPSIPDLSVNFILDELLDMKQIGITLTENGMMHPNASVSGLMLAHPASRYFSIGKIGEDQLADYARRRGMEVEKMRKFLANL